jgi:hypothetical protein
MCLPDTVQLITTVYTIRKACVAQKLHDLKKGNIKKTKIRNLH